MLKQQPPLYRSEMFQIFFKTTTNYLIFKVFLLLLISICSSAASAQLHYYGIHIASFIKQEHVIKEVARLEALQLEAFYQLEMISDKGELYRVFIGPYKSKAEAEKEALSLKK